MKTKIKILALVAVICEAFICLANMTIVVADSGSGGSLGSTCTHYCTSWGAGWHWQDLATFSSWSYDGAGGTGAPASKKAEIVDRCSKYPEGTGVYRLSFERSENRGASFIAGKFSGLVNVGYHVPYQADIADDWNSTYQAFLVAEQHGATDTTWDNTAWFCYNPEWEECDPETDPNCCGVCPTEEAGDGEFWSDSTVQIPAQNGDVPGWSEETSPQDGQVRVEFSTDGSQAIMTFWHEMHYNGANITLYNHDTIEDAVTNWTVTDDFGGYSSSGTFSSAGNVSANSGPLAQHNVTVSLNPGDKKTVCSTINYTNKFNTFTSTATPHYYPYSCGCGQNGCSTCYYLDHYDYHYSVSASGSGSSKSCATVTRPNEPTGDPVSTGTANSTIMYAGESAQIGWDISGTSVATRRLLQWQAIAYLVPVNVNYYDGITSGTVNNSAYMGANRQPLNACSYYARKSNQVWCDTIAGREGSTGFTDGDETHNYSGQRENVVVPDYVGYKYCNSFGYFYQYYYGVDKGSGMSWYPQQTYWNIFNAACRTIAKKPSTTVWNGSLMTAGGVKTSLAWRYDDASMGRVVSDGGDRRLYGSWSEFMSVVGQNNVGLTSGSILSLGHKQGNDEICDGSINNVALTIRNSDCNNLGQSQITNNTTYRTRLATYLENYAAASWNKVTSIASINTSQTNVVNLDGNVTLRNNIELANGPYDSIYKIPQVVIFINGDLNIASNVTRIDAWLIVTGKINTCADGANPNNGFKLYETQSEALSYNRDTTCSRQLVFNGPVLARSLEARRSYGSDNIVTTAGTFPVSGYGKWAAGEVFNFRADNFLWAYAQAGRYNSSYTESYSRELAPRY